MFTLAFFDLTEIFNTNIHFHICFHLAFLLCHSIPANNESLQFNTCPKIIPLHTVGYLI